MDSLSKILIVVVLITNFADARYFNSEEKDTYCGYKLHNLLGQYCQDFPPPDHRVKRQVVDECCKNQCTLNYLVNNYCENLSQEAIDVLSQEVLVQVSTTELPVTVPTRIRNRRLSRKYRQKSSGSVEIDPDNQKFTDANNNSTEKIKKNRKKRHCTCKKNMKKKIAKTAMEEMLKLKSSVPEPRIGSVEEHQPFYIIRKK